MKADRLIVPRWIFDSWRFKITPAGKVLLAGIFFTGLGSISVLIPVYQFFFALISLYLTAWLVGFLLRPKFQIEASFPDSVQMGEAVRVPIRLTNLSKWTVYDVMVMMIGLPKSIQHLSADCVIPAIAGGESATFPLELKATERGHFLLPDIRPHTTFPFNLFRYGSKTHPSGAISVLPAFHPLSEIQVPIGHRYQPGGVALTANLGASPEYIGNREYVPGEPARRLDFRSWARTGKPVIREFQEEYYCRVALILDTHIKRKTWGPFQWDDRTFRFLLPVTLGSDGLIRIGKDALSIYSQQFEAAVSMTAAIGESLCQGEYLIDLFAAGPELYVFRSGQHAAHFDSLLEILSCLEPTANNPFAVVNPTLTEELNSISTAICILLDWDETRERLIQTIQEAGCDLKVIFIGENQAKLEGISSLVPDCHFLPSESIQQGGIESL